MQKSFRVKSFRCQPLPRRVLPPDHKKNKEEFSTPRDGDLFIDPQYVATYSISAILPKKNSKGAYLVSQVVPKSSRLFVR